MNKEAMISAINSKFEELKTALEGDNLETIRELTLDLHAMVHPAEVSGRTEKTIADFVLDYMMKGNQNEFVQRETWDTDLKYAGSKTVPICWQFWHTYRIEDLVSNILMANGKLRLAPCFLGKAYNRRHDFDSHDLPSHDASSHGC